MGRAHDLWRHRQKTKDTCPKPGFDVPIHRGPKKPESNSPPFESSKESANNQKKDRSLSTIAKSKKRNKKANGKANEKQAKKRKTS